MSLRIIFQFLIKKIEKLENVIQERDKSLGL